MARRQQGMKLLQLNTIKEPVKYNFQTCSFVHPIQIKLLCVFRDSFQTSFSAPPTLFCISNIFELLYGYFAAKEFHTTYRHIIG